jgi:hypothetical protein
MYNTKLICTYSYYDPLLREKFHSEENFDISDVEGFDDLVELIYKTELLKAFCMNDRIVCNNFDNIEFETDKIVEIFNIMKVEDNFMDCVRMVNEKYNQEGNLETSFIMLFSYDYFFISHKCICEFLLKGIISDINIENLKNLIKI